MDKTLELILVASVLMITAIFAITAFTSSFSDTKGFLDNLNQQTQDAECEGEVKGGGSISSECLDQADQQTEYVQSAEENKVVRTCKFTSKEC